MKLLIVDDEATIRENLSQLVKERFPGIFDIFLANDGQQALEIISAKFPEIVLSDIRMPRLSGLEMLRQMRERKFTAEVIFFSGYDDYASVRNAMKMGAVDYLLKPIIEEELYSLLQSFLKRSTMKPPDQNGDTLTLERVREDELLQQYALEHLLQGETDILPTEGNFLHWILFIAEKGGWQRDLIQEANRSGLFSLRGSYRGHEAVLLSGAKKTNLPLLLQAAGEIPVVSCSDSPEKALSEALSAIRDRFYDLEGEPGPEQFPFRDLCGKISRAAAEGLSETFINKLHILFLRFAAQKPEVDSLKQICTSIVYDVMAQKGAFVPVFSSMELTDMDILLSISQADKASKLEEKFQKIMLKMMETVYPQEDFSDNYHMNQAIKLIREHYAEDLTLTRLAESLELNPNYVSTLFRNVMGIPFIQFLRKVRIEAACQLLRDSSEKIYLIGDQVGYSDAVHFTRIFKEETGVSPKEYRKKMGNGMSRTV